MLGKIGKAFGKSFKMAKEGKQPEDIANMLRSEGFSVTYKTNAPQTVDVTASTMSNKKYASIGRSQMRSGRRSTIKTSSTGLTSAFKTSKKTLLGE